MTLIGAARRIINALTAMGAVGVMTLYAISLHGAEPVQPSLQLPKTLVFWVDVKGEILEQIPVQELHWNWTALSVGGVEIPSLLVRIKPNLPKELKVDRREPTALLFQDHGEEVTVDLYSANAALKYFFKDASQRPVERSLAFVTEIDQPKWAIHPDCSDLDLQFIHKFPPGGKGAKNLFYGLHCQKKEAGFQFSLFHSQDSRWIGQQPDIIQTVVPIKPPTLKEDLEEVLRVKAEDDQQKPIELHVFHRARSWKKVGPPFLSASVGFSILSYSESGFPDLQEMASTVKASYLRPLPFENWDAAIGGYATALVFSSSIPNVEARYLGLNARVGYNFPKIKEPWKLTLLGGWYYTTMFVTDDAFGYENLQGPQVFPVVRRQFSPNLSASGYAKYAPITVGVGVLNPASSRELAAGGSVTWKFKDAHLFTLATDFSNLQLEALGRTVKSNTINISVGYNYVFPVAPAVAK